MARSLEGQSASVRLRSRSGGSNLLLSLHRPQPPAPPMEIVVSLVEAAAKPVTIIDEATAVEKAPQAAQSDERVVKPLPMAEPPRARQNLSNAFQPAQKLFAAALDDPRNAEAREALRTLTADERRIQLCNLEAMEQLRRTSHVSADMIAPYAFQDLAIHADEIIADGAAVRTGRDWRCLRYRCAIGTAADAPSRLATKSRSAVERSLPDRRPADRRITSGIEKAARSPGRPSISSCRFSLTRTGPPHAPTWCRPCRCRR